MFHANPDFPHLAMAKLAEKYGDVMSLQLGSHNFGEATTQRQLALTAI